VARGGGLARRPGGRPVSSTVAAGCGGNRYRTPGSGTVGRGMSSRYRYATGCQASAGLIAGVMVVVRAR